MTTNRTPEEIAAEVYDAGPTFEAGNDINRPAWIKKIADAIWAERWERAKLRDALTKVEEEINEYKSFMFFELNKLEIARKALRRMMSEETDWPNGAVGVGYTFRTIAKEAIREIEKGDK